MPKSTTEQASTIVHLDEFQRWMVAVVSHFGTDEEAWNSEGATTELSHERALGNVLPSQTLTEYERIGIYRRMYFLRMRDALLIDVPSVRFALGQSLFEEVVEQYFTRYPSRSYTLNDSGLMFPTFVRESSLPNNEFLAELAELELAISRVIEAPETPPLTAEQIAAVPADAWENVCFVPIAALELHAFTYPVHDYFCAFEEKSSENETSDEPSLVISEEPAYNYVCIHRSDYNTEHTAVTEAEYELLTALTESGPLGVAFEAVQKHFGDNPADAEKAQQHITSRFQEWMMSGLFAAIRT